MVKIHPYRNEPDHITGIVLSLIDITQRKFAENALLRQHELLVRVLDTNGSATIMVNHRGAIIYANAGAVNLLGYSHDEINGWKSPARMLQLLDIDGGELPFGSESLYAMFVHTKDNHSSYRLSYIPGPASPHAATRTVVSITGSPIFDDEDTIEGAVLSITPTEDTSTS